MMRARYSEEITLLAIIGESTSPVGARKVTDALHHRGVRISESTVSRLFRKLDAQNLTRATDSKGRVLTLEGRRRLATLQAAERRGEAVTGIKDINSVQDLLDLLLARRGVEREAARAAASRATADEITQLAELVSKHEQRLAKGEVPREDALNFHRLISAASGNKLLVAMADLVFDPLLDKTEEILDVIVGSHHSEARSIFEHKAVVEAIAARDVDAAEAAMVEHVNRLILEVEEFASGDQAALFDRMLAWVKAEAV